MLAVCLHQVLLLRCQTACYALLLGLVCAHFDCPAIRLSFTARHALPGSYLRTQLLHCQPALHSMPLLQYNLGALGWQLPPDDMAQLSSFGTQIKYFDGEGDKQTAMLPAASKQQKMSVDCASAGLKVMQLREQVSVRE